MKTKPMQHQRDALDRLDGKRNFALFMEQGTGKSWTALADAERAYAAGKIDALFILAPKGVHTNWVRREIPTHLEAHTVARAWRSGAGKREMAAIEEVMKPRREGEIVPLRVLAMNIDAVNTDKGYKFAEAFLLCTKAMFILDEAHRIKNPTAARTKAILRLGPLAVARRILTGTPVTQAPMDVFSPMEFLRPGLLGTTSYRAFTAEYAELMSPTHPMMQEMIKRNPKAAHAQIVRRNPDGSPRYRNLDKLQSLLAPYSFRVLKADCLDLPDKVYSNHYFELSPGQRRAYDLLQDELRVKVEELEGPVSVQRLAAIVKLQQITSGFVNVAPHGLQYIADDNPRLAALKDWTEDLAEGEKVIVWARFKEEIAQIARMLAAEGIEAVQYHGSVGDAEREAAVDSFQTGSARVFIGQPQSGGIGITLTAASVVIYYSNDFNRETRAQSEDRAHRIGQRRSVRYVDLLAMDTIDEKIADVLQRKKTLAEIVLGDAR